MLQKFKDDIGCITRVRPQVCSFLMNADDNEFKLYFIVNTGCASRSMTTIQEGYNCNNEKIAIADFTEIKNSEKVASKNGM